MATGDGSGKFGDAQDHPVTSHRRIAESGSDIERWQLAGQEDVARDVWELLVAHARGDVRWSIATNSSVPGDLLAELVQRYPDTTEAVALNPNAPVSLKEDAPIGSHSLLSLSRFLHEVGATADEKRALTDLYEASPHPGGVALREAWQKVKSTS